MTLRIRLSPDYLERVGIYVSSAVILAGSALLAWALLGLILYESRP